MEIRPDDALLIIDVQNDFCPGGALAVERGDEIVPICNALAPQFDTVVLTQDWHRPDHASFASAHTDARPYDTIRLPYGEQVLWPDHCVAGTPGADFHPDLDTVPAALVLRKGNKREVDSYSAFRENDLKTRTGLASWLRERGIRRIFLTGLAEDFCVRWSAIDAIEEGFEAVVVLDAVRAIDLDGSLDQAWEEMTRAGVERVRSDTLLLAAGVAG